MAIVLARALAGPIHAQTFTYWQHDPNTPGDWAEPDNWTPRLPEPNDTAIIDNGGTASISSGNIEVANMTAGSLFAGSITQSGGTSEVGWSLTLGQYPGSSGAYNLSAGSLTSYGLVVALSGTGVFQQSGGTNVALSPVFGGAGVCLGASAGSVGTYQLIGGSLVSYPYEYVGAAGEGTFIQSGGTHTVGSMMQLGRQSGSTGTYILSGGSLSSPYHYVGYSGVGAFTQSRGTNAVSSSLYVGYQAGSTGTYNLTGGSASSQYQYLGGGGMGTLTQSGGTNTVRSCLSLGYFAGSTGTYNLSAGSLSSLYQCVGHGTSNLPPGGYGIFAQCGGTNAVTSYLCLGSCVGSTGTYELSGGFLICEDQWVGRRGMGTLTQSGGTNAVSSSLSLGYQPGCTGTYNLTGGSLTSLNQYLGTNIEAGPGGGEGTFAQSGGVNTVRGTLCLGRYATSTGTYILSGGSLSSPCQYVGISGEGTFIQSGGMNTVSGTIYLGYYSSSTGAYTITGGSLDAREGLINVGQSGVGAFVLSGGTVVAGKISVSHGLVNVGKDAVMTSGGFDLADSASSVTKMSFELSAAKSALISSAVSGTTGVIIGEGGDHTLDLQTGVYRPREGDEFNVMTGFNSISGTFDHVTTNITVGQQNDPNGLPIPFFAAGAVADPNDPNNYALQVVFCGLTAGDTNGDHAVSLIDLGTLASNWGLPDRTWATADFDGDGVCGLRELGVLALNWGWTRPDAAPPIGAAPIPEPVSAVLLLAGAIGLLRHRGRR